MNENVEANAHVIDADDYLAGLGFQTVCLLKTLSKGSNAPPGIAKDWKTLEEWLGCEGRELNQQDKDRIGRAYKSYYAIGIAPSLSLQPTFDQYRQQAKREKWEIVSIPSVVREVFDRQLATDKELEEKKKAEQLRLKQLVEHRQKHQSKSSDSTDNHAKKFFFNKKIRICIVSLTLWTSYVVFRTCDYYEVFGVELRRWDSGSFWLNLLLPPIVIFMGIYLLKWIQRGTK